MRKAARDFATLFGLALWITVMIQYSVKGRFEYPFMGMKFPLFIANSVLALTPLVALNLFVDLIPVMMGAVLVTLAFVFANQIKIRNLHQPIVIFDIYNLNPSALMLRYVGWREIIVLGLGFGLLVFWSFRRIRSLLTRLRNPMPPSQRDERWRLLGAKGILALPVLVFTMLAVLEGAGKITVFNPNFTMNGYDPFWGPDVYGYLVSTVARLKYLTFKEPPGYTQHHVDKILAYDMKDTRIPMSRAKGRPDVVLVLLESFKDFSGAGVKFKKDVIPFYHRLRKESVTWPFLSPVFGGGTANAEFEILTGMPLRFFPAGASPYALYIRRRTPSVVGWYAKNGYQTIAIHDNSKSFWARNKVYPLIGFSGFEGARDLQSALGKAGEVKDRDLFQRSVNLLKKQNRSPQFQFLITIGTHGPYAADSAQRKWYLPEGNAHSSVGAVGAINDYGDKIHRLDGDLAWYFDQLRHLKNPPTVILFGDHQPSVSLDLPIAQDPATLHQVEVLVWNGPKKTSLDTAKSTFSCLGPLLIRSARLPLTPYFDFVERFCREHPDAGLSEVGAIPAPVPGAPLAKDLERYRILSYDRLFGHGFSRLSRLEISLTKN